MNSPIEEYIGREIALAGIDDGLCGLERASLHMLKWHPEYAKHIADCVNLWAPVAELQRLRTHEQAHQAAHFRTGGGEG